MPKLNLPDGTVMHLPAKIAGKLFKAHAVEEVQKEPWTIKFKDAIVQEVSKDANFKWTGLSAGYFTSGRLFCRTPLPAKKVATGNQFAELKSKRQLAQLKLDDVATAAGMHREALRQIEEGRIRSSVETVTTISKAMDRLIELKKLARPEV